MRRFEAAIRVGMVAWASLTFLSFAANLLVRGRGWVPALLAQVAIIGTMTVVHVLERRDRRRLALLYRQRDESGMRDAEERFAAAVRRLERG